MKIELAGTFDVIAPVSEAYGFLTDPSRFAPLLPMFKELSGVEADRFRVVLDVGMPQIRGKAEANVVFVERHPDQRAVMRSTMRHALGMADSDMSFDLVPEGAGSRVSWRCSSTVRGTLASLASGILAPLARRNVDAMIASVQEELGAVHSEAGTVPLTPAEGASATPPSPRQDLSVGWWARLGAWFARAFGAGGRA